MQKTNEDIYLFTDYLPTPVGMLQIKASELGLLSVLFVEKCTHVSSNALTQAAKSQLSEYFDGSRTQFALPLAVSGTQFQLSVWQQLQQIRYGQTCSYADVAVALANPKAVRAVGAANGKNPISIIVPCHRVIGANGQLTGYAGGITRKQWLLEWERKHV